jgi:hypothetical protein
MPWRFQFNCYDSFFGLSFVCAKSKLNRLARSGHNSSQYNACWNAGMAERSLGSSIGSTSGVSDQLNRSPRSRSIGSNDIDVRTTLFRTDQNVIEIRCFGPIETLVRTDWTKYAVWNQSKRSYFSNEHYTVSNRSNHSSFSCCLMLIKHQSTASTELLEVVYHTEWTVTKWINSKQ